MALAAGGGAVCFRFWDDLVNTAAASPRSVHPAWKVIGAGELAHGALWEDPR
ncbi:MAG: hypothetical protein KIT72_08405 [Polyangiaceae bacterium]|nr:hypothetical protein [Polyangiaceae bacterium]MCW5790429.1 hypothetical protein [Polyangiaceae bacterium]